MPPTRDEPRFAVRVLGPFSVDHDGGRIDIGGPKPSLLVALLVANLGEVVPVDALVDGLWGDEPPATAKKAIQVNVSLARKSLGEDFALVTAGRGYLIEPDRVTVDERAFMDDVDRASLLVDASPGDAVAALNGALARWNGSAYADFHDCDALQGRIVALTERRLHAIKLLFDARLELGHHHEVIGELDALAAEHPYREEFRRLHMLALYRSGRQTDALRAYERTRDLLLDELGLEPSGELSALQHQILEHSPELGAPTSATVLGLSGTDVAAGQAVRGYELRQEVDATEDAIRFRGYQSSVGRQVEVKVIRPGAANRPDFVKRFHADAQHIAALEHPHIVPLYDYWRDPNGAYVVTQWLAAGSVADALASAPFEPPAALRLLGQVGAALSYVHRNGVVHGAVEPRNVLLDEEGNAFLSGFDFARSADASDAIEDDLLAFGVLAEAVLSGTRSHPVGLEAILVRATDPERRFERIDDLLRALRQVFGADVAVRELPTIDVRNPYKGLRAFVETDAVDYFGREATVASVLDHVRRSRLTAIVGPSGCGKSSLVKAGILPPVRASGFGDGRDVVVAQMFPGSYPFEELEAALMQVAVDRPADLLKDLLADDRGILRSSKQILPDDDTDLLLVVDQFEELFTLTQDESVRRRFLDNLVAVAHDERSRVRVILTLRADFFDRPLEYPDFGELLSDALIPLAMPTRDELARAIAAPATAAGLELESGLVSVITRDVADEPGALPLMQYALTELVEARDGHDLTIAAYERTGGVIGALARRAEEIFSGLPEIARGVAEEVFVHLVSVDEDSNDTRRRVRRTELDALGLNAAALDTVIADFGSFRLLSFDHDPVTRGQTIEVAHEALIREWPRFRSWVDGRRESLILQRRLQPSVTEWESSGGDPSFLFNGGRLEQYESWAASPEVRLGSGEREFLSESRRVETAERRRVARRNRRVFATVCGLAALAAIIAVAAVIQQRRAVASTERAEQATLISQAGAVGADDPELALLLALEANRRAPGAASEQAVLNALVGTSFATRVASHDLLPGDCVGFSVFWTQDYGALEWDTIDGRIIARDTLTGEITDHGPPPVDCAVAFVDPGGAQMAVGNAAMSHWVGPDFGTEISFDVLTLPLWVTEDRYFVLDFENEMQTVSIFDVASGEQFGEPITNAIFLAIAVSAEGDLAAFSFVNPLAPEGDGRLVVVDTATGQVVWQEDYVDGITALRFDPASGDLIASELGGSIWTIDPRTGEIMSSVASDAFEIRALGVRPDGAIVAVDSGSIQVIDRFTGPTGLRAELRDAVEPRVRADGKVVLVVPDGRVDVFDVDTSAIADQVWQVPPTAQVSIDAGQAAITDGTPTATTVLDLSTGETTVYSYELADGSRFDARSVFPDGDGLWAIGIDMVATYWVDGELVEQLDLGSDPTVVGVRKGPRQAGVNRLGDLYGVFGNRTNGIWEASLARLSPGAPTVLFTAEMPAGVAIIDVHPAAAGGLHVLRADTVLATYDADGALVSEIDTNPDDVLGDLGGDDRIGRMTVDATTELIAIGDFAGKLTIIDPGTERLVFPSGFVETESLGFIRNGQYLALTGRSGSVRLWDVARAEPAGLLFDGSGSSGGEAPWYDEEADSVWVNASGQVVQLPLDPQRWVGRACEIVTRELTPDEWTRFVPGDDEARSACG